MPLNTFLALRAFGDFYIFQTRLFFVSNLQCTTASSIPLFFDGCDIIQLQFGQQSRIIYNLNCLALFFKGFS
jgi:hypothetical protein